MYLNCTLKGKQSWELLRFFIGETISHVDNLKFKSRINTAIISLRQHNYGFALK